MLQEFEGSSFSALTAAAALASVGVAIAALEDITTIRDFRGTGLMSWDICRLRSGWTSRGRIAGWLDSIFRYQGFRALLALRGVAAVVVAIGASVGELLPAPILIVFGSTLALSVRSPYGLDGAHQMYLVVFGSLFLASLNSTDRRLTAAVGVFIAAQVLLAYLVSGATKAGSDKWRSGTAIPGIMATFIYGNAKLHSLLVDRPTLSLMTCWWVIGVECTFPIAALIGTPYLEIYLGAGVLFHALTALVMGLNGFFFAFVATYPCVIYASAAWTGLF